MTTPVQFLRPSGAATWTVCTGYIAMRAVYPDAPDEADNDVREDGTACHWLAYMVWMQNNDDLNQCHGLAPNGRTLTDEMYDAVSIYLDVLKAWPCQAYVEKLMDCSIIYPGMMGTPDAWGYDPKTRTLYVADLKFGFRFVEVYRNLQLICYAAAIIAFLYEQRMGVDRIEFTIVQPRSFHREGAVRKWHTSPEEINAYVSWLQAQAHAAMSGGDCTPNPGCVDCPARHGCVSLQNAALIALEQSYGSVPFELSAIAAGKELEILKRASRYMESRITGLEAQLEGMLRAGMVVPGYALVTGYSRETWQEGKDAEIITLGRLMGHDLAKPSKAITPAQARKKLPANLVDSYAHRPSNGTKLTKLDSLHAHKAFNNEAPSK